MTQHEEAVRLGDKFAGSKHVGGHTIAGLPLHKAYTFTRAELAALIAEVRRKADDRHVRLHVNDAHALSLLFESAMRGVEGAEQSDSFRSAFEALNSAITNYNAIRARLEEGK